MTSFDAVERRIAVTCARQPDFPRQSAVLVRLVKTLHKRVHDDANALLRPLGINHPEYNLLMMLYGTEDFTLCPGQLAEAAVEKNANITRLVDGLTAKGLVARSGSDTDRRMVTVTLTEQGRTLLEGLLPQVRDLLDRQTQRMSARDMTQLETLLKRLLDSIEQS